MQFIRGCIFMKRKKRGKKAQHRGSPRLFIATLILSFSISMGASYFYFKDKFSFESSFIAEIESRIASEDVKDRDIDVQRLYKTKGSDQLIQGSMIFRKDTLLVTAEDFIRQHLSSYRANLLDLYLDQEGTIYIDFGSEIKKKFRGDAYGEMNVLAGLFKGMKNIVPGLSAIKILIEGKEAETFGGHIDISKPLGEEIAYSIQ